jgi:hypothetical protein
MVANDKPDLTRICLLVSSSDNTADVLRQVAPSLGGFWPDCPFDRFVGVNSAAAADTLPFRALESPLLGGWRPELAHQIASLPTQYTHILLILDDFLLLETVETSRIIRLAARVLSDDIAYLRLVPELHSLWGGLYRTVCKRADADDIAPLPDDTPYYSSLQATIWRRDHLAARLADEGSIWDFELWRGSEPHFAVNGPPALRYRHVVERGQWMADAPRLFARAGLPFEAGARPVANTADWFAWLWSRMKFAMVGYALYRRRLRRQGRL